MSKINLTNKSSEDDEKGSKIPGSLLVRVTDSQSKAGTDSKEGLTDIALNQKERFLRALRLFLSDKK
jgi:hypothetical protein